MSAAARAEARRKAILARGGDRLAKLTSSARGEDAPAYMHDDPPLAPLPGRPGVSKFVGEETDMPTPPSVSRNATSSGAPPTAPIFGAGMSDPSAWSEEQQMQFMNALLGGGPRSAPLPGQPRISAMNEAADTSSIPSTDPLAALMASMGQPGMPGMGGFMPPTGAAAAAGKQVAVRPRTLLQRLAPLIHLVAAWMLLAYFVIWREPGAYIAETHIASSSDVFWKRWADLAWRAPDESWGVRTVPFFWAFTTLALVLHSWRIFTGMDAVQMPMLLAFALPHLPPPLPSIITNSFQYLRIGSIFLDDIAGLLVGIGLLIWIASWIAGQ